MESSKKDILIVANKNLKLFDIILDYFAYRKDIRIKLLCENEKSSVYKKAKKLNLETFIVNNQNIEPFLNNISNNLIVKLDYKKEFEEEIYKTNTVINFHPSLLPKYQESDAIEKAYINKDLSTGITIFKELSSSEIEVLNQTSIEIDKKWNIKKLRKKIEELEYYYYPRAIEKILKLNVLVIGSSSIECCLIEQIKKSPLLNKLFVISDNDFIKENNEIITHSSKIDLLENILIQSINLVFINSKSYLDDKLINELKKHNIKVINTHKKDIQKYTSKSYFGKLIQKYNIKCPPYTKISKIKDINKYMSYFKVPIIKVDTYTDGIGIYDNKDKEKVKLELYKYLNGKFSDSSKACLIEEKIKGDKTNLLALYDGENILYFPSCKIYKKSSNDLYTSGLACVCPDKIVYNYENKIQYFKKKFERLLKEEKIKFSFMILFELTILDNELYLTDISFNPTSPHIETIMNYVENDWLEILYLQATKNLNNIELKYKDKELYALTMTSKGYPLKTRTDKIIKNILNVNDFIKIYFSNIIKKDGEYISKEGKLLNIISSRKNEIYKYLKQIDFEEKDFLQI